MEARIKIYLRDARRFLEIEHELAECVRGQNAAKVRNAAEKTPPSRRQA